MSRHVMKDGRIAVKGADGKMLGSIAPDTPASSDATPVVTAAPKTLSPVKARQTEAGNRVAALIDAYMAEHSDEDEANWSVLGDLVADILHYADSRGVDGTDGDRVLRMASMHFEEERDEESADYV